MFPIKRKMSWPIWGIGEVFTKRWIPKNSWLKWPKSIYLCHRYVKIAFFGHKWIVWPKHNIFFLNTTLSQKIFFKMMPDIKVNNRKDANIFVITTVCDQKLWVLLPLREWSLPLPLLPLPFWCLYNLSGKMIKDLHLKIDVWEVGNTWVVLKWEATTHSILNGCPN